MDILEKIKQRKLEEIKELKKIYTTSNLLSLNSNIPSLSLKKAILDPNKNGIIAEFKRRSPSKGQINNNANLINIIKGYQQFGASAISVLFDKDFFGAEISDLPLSRAHCQIPILQKEFILDEIQIAQAKSLKADAILLIAKLLPVNRLKELANYAHTIGLEVLLETQNELEIEQHQDTSFDLIGINNRNLRTFSMDINNSINLVNQLPPQTVKIAESGIHSAAVYKKLKENGFNGFLMGEQFMKQEDPAQGLKYFINQLNYDTIENMR